MQGWNDDEIDPRAIPLLGKYLSNPSGDRYRWDPQSGALPTMMIRSRALSMRPICAYCGRLGLILQSNIRSGDFRTTGHTCICKDALNSLEVEKEIEVLKSKFREKLRELEDKKPKMSESVVKMLLEKEYLATLREAEDKSPWRFHDKLRDYNIFVDKQEDLL